MSEPKTALDLADTNRGHRVAAEDDQGAAVDRDAMIERWCARAVTDARKVTRSIPGDELESAAMRGLLQAIDRFDPERGAGFDAYLYYKVRSAVLDHVRFNARRADRSRVRFHPLECSEDPPAPSTVDNCETAELAGLAMRALRNSPRQLEAVELYFYEGRTLREIGARMGFSEGRASQQVRGALRKMRRALGVS